MDKVQEHGEKNKSEKMLGGKDCQEWKTEGYKSGKRKRRGIRKREGKNA